MNHDPKTGCFLPSNVKAADDVPTKAATVMAAWAVASPLGSSHRTDVADIQPEVAQRVAEREAVGVALMSAKPRPDTVRLMPALGGPLLSSRKETAGADGEG